MKHTLHTKKIFSIILSLILIISVFSDSLTSFAEPDPEHVPASGYDENGVPYINSTSAIVINADTGQILYEKDAYSVHYPASTTKIMTTLVALENGNPEDVITMQEDAVYGIEYDSSSISLQVGEQITLEQALYAVMLASANEAAWGVADHIGGNLSNYTAMMNQRASEIGCKNTHFTNANGLHDDNHYSTAYDLALITREALKNDEFRKITSTLQYTIPPTNITQEERILNQNNKMINPNYPEFYYEYCTGGKTGYTQKAGGTFVAWAEKDGVELICVTLETTSNKENFYDTTELFKYCFNAYYGINPVEGFTFSEDDITRAEALLNEYYGKGENLLPLSLSTENGYMISVPAGQEKTDITVSFEPSIYGIENNIIGELVVQDSSTVYYKLPVTFDGYLNSEDDEAVEAAYASGVLQRPPKEKSSPLGRILLITFLIIIIALAILFYFRLQYIRKKREQYKRRRDRAKRRNQSF